jgi:PAS domain S-box-containing protein
MNTHKQTERRTAYILILIFVFLTAGIVTASSLYYLDYEKRYRAGVESQLSAIADLKVGELTQFRKERLSDAAVLFRNVSFSALIRHFLENPRGADAQRQVQAWIDKYQANYQYDRVFLLDARGVVRMSAPTGPEPISAIISRRASEILRSGLVTFQDFYRDEHNQRIYLAVLVPVFDEPADRRLLGVLVLRIDPTVYLYPFISRWPIPSRTAETLLIRRDGNDALFLNDVRFQTDSALNLRIPLTRGDNPGVNAALGRKGLVEGPDYRGVPVIAQVRRVPDAPWSLVARMDTSEVYAPLRGRLWEIVGLAGVLLLGAAGATGFLWRQQRMRFYRERYQAAEVLAESEERHQTILQTAIDGFWLVDSLGSLLEVNAAYCRMSGYSAEELLTMRIPDLQAAETGTDIAAHIQKIMTQGEDRFESRHRRKDGSVFDVEVNILYRPFAGGQFVAFLRDITERKRAEEVANRYLSALQREHSASDGMNQELREKAKSLADQKAEVEVKNDEVEQARKDLEDKAAQLTLTSKYKSEFLANMSHELRSPLNNLLILAKLLADNAEGNLTEKQTKFAHTIHSSGTDLLTLINDILDLARVESGKLNIEPAAVYLADLREMVIQDFSHVALSKGTEFRVLVDPDLPDSIQTDPTRLHQILKNLMSNALKFTERGAVRMEIKLAKSGWRPGTSGLDRAERVVAFSVVDTGIGIPPEKQRIVFEAFQQADGTTSRRYGGTGLGLSISRDIAQLLGGDLTLQSQVGVGSTFTLFLPAIRCKEMRPPQPAAGVEAIPAAPARPLPQRLASACDAVAMSALARMVAAQEPVEDDHLTLRKTDRPVLIVENDATFASMLLEKVHARSLKGVVVMRGGPVVRMVREMAPMAVTLDILLPDMSGWVVLEALKRDPATRHVPVHVVTICEERRRAMTMGAASFLHKTLNPGELDAVFDRILNELKTPVRNVLVVDGDPARGPSLVELLGNGDIHTIPAASGAEVSAALRKQRIDGAVLGWNVAGLAGLDLLTILRDATGRGELRVLIYPETPLSQADKDGIAAWDDAAVIQIASSPEDLLDKSMTMFHRKETELPRDKRDKLAAARAVDRRLAGRKILIVDDDLRNIFALTSALETHDMNLTLAENGRKGIEALRANPDVELVLMDIMLPEMDGYQAMRAIRKMPQYRELPVIALTAQAMKGDRERCIEAGATDYIAKPVEIDQLLALMRVWLPEAQKA